MDGPDSRASSDSPFLSHHILTAFFKSQVVSLVGQSAWQRGPLSFQSWHFSFYLFCVNFTAWFHFYKKSPWEHIQKSLLSGLWKFRLVNSDLEKENFKPWDIFLVRTRWESKIWEILFIQFDFWKLCEKLMICPQRYFLFLRFISNTLNSYFSNLSDL